MVDAFRSMLDELMGKERDVPLDKRQNRALQFDDKDICKYELVALCPNRLFRNTKSDLGSCGYEIHDDHLEWPTVKEQWDKLSQREKDSYPFERDLLRYMESLIRDMDGKIRKNKERAEAESRPKVLKLDDQKRLDEIKERQAELVARAAQLGESGDVDGALAATNQADNLGKQHESLYKQLTEPERTMTVCDICGVFINSTDNDQRRLDHLTGKQYLGWKKIREIHADIIKQREERLRGGLPDRRRSSSREAAAADRGHSSRDGDRGSSRDRERARDSERDRRGSSRDYHRGSSRERDYRRERESDREYRDRYDRRDRDRDRDRDRSPRRRSDHRDHRYAEVPPPGYGSRSERDYRR